MSTNKFKVGDKVRCVKAHLKSLTFNQVYTIERASGGNYDVRNDLGCVGGYPDYVFKVVESTNEYLTPEEVFEHLRKGTKLERKRKDVPSRWVSVDHAVYIHQVDDYDWRIKPEPEIITLNGKRYQALED